MAEPERLVIERLGSRGDGVADGPEGLVYVPYALPGETVLAMRDGARATLVAVETPSPDRIEPFCPYFGGCGGCLTQHMGGTTYAAWKRGLVVDALAKARVEAPVAPLVDAHGRGRRRLTLHARPVEGEVSVGYMAARSHRLIAIDRCPVAEPALQASPTAALALARILARSRKPLDIQLTVTESGLDVDIRGHGPAGARLQATLVAAADRLDLARLSLHGEVLVERRPPLIAMGPTSVRPPPGAFLQATRAGEEALSALVGAACAGARRVADLFAGCGSFALRLAAGAEVHAVEADAAALAALDRAARAKPGLKRVVTEARDLFRRPLLASDLDRFDAVVFDPPRAGAEAQARQLAASRAPVIVGVSCDAGTFARDAALLIAGGYRLADVTPVDQFKHTAHVEVVGVFRRPERRVRG